MSNNNPMLINYFDDCQSFKSGLARVCKNGKWGYINTNGVEIVPIEFNDDDLSLINQIGTISIKKSGKWVFVDTTGKEIFYKEIIEEHTYEQTPDLIPVSVEKGWKLIDNRVYVPIKKWGFKNKQGKIVVPIKYDHVGKFKEGLAVIEIGYRAGFINAEGKEVIPPQYDDYLWGNAHAIEMYGFSEGLSPVMKEGKWGFIDKNGAVIIPFEYDYADEFYCGYANVRKGSKWGLVDKQGKEIVSTLYDERIEPYLYPAESGLREVSII